MSAATKRTFLTRAFHPAGSHACETSGMISTSPEVEEAEFQAAQRSLDSIPDSIVEHVIERAAWITDVLNTEDWASMIDIGAPIGTGQAVCPDCGSPCAALTLQEILVKFYLAVRLEELDHGQLVR